MYVTWLILYLESICVLLDICNDETYRLKLQKKVLNFKKSPKSQPEALPYCGVNTVCVVLVVSKIPYLLKQTHL